MQMVVGPLSPPLPFDTPFDARATIACEVPEYPGGPFSMAIRPYMEIDPDTAMPQPNSKIPTTN